MLKVNGRLLFGGGDNHCRGMVLGQLSGEGGAGEDGDTGGPQGGKALRHQTAEKVGPRLVEPLGQGDQVAAIPVEVGVDEGVERGAKFRRNTDHQEFSPSDSLLQGGGGPEVLGKGHVGKVEGVLMPLVDALHNLGLPSPHSHRQMLDSGQVTGEGGSPGTGPDNADFTPLSCQKASSPFRP